MTTHPHPETTTGALPASIFADETLAFAGTADPIANALNNNNPNCVFMSVSKRFEEIEAYFGRSLVSVPVPPQNVPATGSWTQTPLPPATAALAMMATEAARLTTSAMIMRDM